MSTYHVPPPGRGARFWICPEHPGVDCVVAPVRTPHLQLETSHAPQGSFRDQRGLG